MKIKFTATTKELASGETQDVKLIQVGFIVVKKSSITGKKTPRKMVHVCIIQ